MGVPIHTGSFFFRDSISGGFNSEKSETVLRDHRPISRIETGDLKASIRFVTMLPYQVDQQAYGAANGTFFFE